MLEEDPFYDAVNELERTLRKAEATLGKSREQRLMSSEDEVEFDALCIDGREQIIILKQMLEVFITRCQNAGRLDTFSNEEIKKRKNVCQHLEKAIIKLVQEKDKMIDSFRKMSNVSEKYKIKDVKNEEYYPFTANPDTFLLKQEETQRLETENQDLVLDRLTYGLTLLRETGTNINDELTTQHSVLNEVDRDVSRLQVRLRAANAKVDRLLASMSNRGKICTIVCLIIVLCFLAIFVFR